MITIAHVDQPAEAAPLLRVLRSGLDDALFEERLAKAVRQGYRVLAAYHGAAMAGVLGYRLVDDLCWGRTFYVDDLVVAETVRGQGVGAALLDKARALAADCDHMRLCSGLQRHEAHRFYEANGMRRSSLQFVTETGG